MSRQWMTLMAILLVYIPVAIGRHGIACGRADAQRRAG
ncbi:methyl viologen resistance protein SmvA [Klebsiella aerogenes]|nr:methyl viologen resistance protein SmvA [Klebsiella aerogenes]